MENDMKILLLTILLTGCSITNGREFEIADANRICDGMSKNEVMGIMKSKPMAVSGNTFTWYYSESGLTGWDMRKATVQFDDNGKITGLPNCNLFENVDTGE